MSPAPWRRAIGQCLIAGFDGLEIPVELRNLSREFGLGGVILFARNIADPEQVAATAFEAARLSPDLPAWVSVDQEGGRVARLREPFTRWPPMAALGRSGSTALAERFAHALAAELTAVGITLDYAPVLDIHTNPKNPVIGDRALAERADEVARLGVAIITALQKGGVAACGKHFPGHGDTSVDSHLDLPIVEHPPERLRDVELVPFRAAVAAGVATIMTAHVLLPAFDEAQPATLSRAILQGLLRGDLGYDGVVLSDDLQMQAVAKRMDVPSAAVAAIAAGCDAVLICGGDTALQVAALEALVHAVEDGTVPMAAIDDAIRRQRSAKERILSDGPSRPATARMLRDVLGRAEHAAVADEMARFV